MPRNTGAPLLHKRTLGDKLHQLGKLAPLDVAAIEVLVDDALARHLTEQTESILRLVRHPDPPKG